MSPENLRVCDLERFHASPLVSRLIGPNNGRIPQLFPLISGYEILTFFYNENN